VQARQGKRTSSIEVELLKQKIASIQNQEEHSVKEEERKAAEHFSRQQQEAKGQQSTL